MPNFRNQCFAQTQILENNLKINDRSIFFFLVVFKQKYIGFFNTIFKQVHGKLDLFQFNNNITVDTYNHL